MEPPLQTELDWRAVGRTHMAGVCLSIWVAEVRAWQGGGDVTQTGSCRRLATWWPSWVLSPLSLADVLIS